MIFVLTGSSGFIGRHICEYLTNQGHSIYKIARGVEYELPQSDYTFIHMAAYGNHRHQTEVKETISKNLAVYQITRDMPKTKHLVKFYNFSSSSVTLKNHTLYSATKLVGEKIIESLKDPRFINVRPYTVFGPGDNPNHFIPKVIHCLKTGEKMQIVTEPVHDYIYVGDFVKALFNSPIPQNRILEIGSGIATSNIEIVFLLEHISKKKLNFEAVDKMRDYDNLEWCCPNPVPSRRLYEALKLTYEATV